ncbi:MAG: ArgE/DapE family deacylase [Methanosarcinales archaeon]|nr:ArgE/DapE family deacylase [Methanosarcinales archaeon]
MKLETVNRYLESHQDHLMDLLRELISFKTVAPPGSYYQEVVDYLVPIFKEMGFKTEKLIMPGEVFLEKCTDPRLVGDRVNLRASLDVGAKETLIIYTHLDVVPPGDNWSTDPFTVQVKEGRVYGRGVSDSKGAVAGMIAALQAVRKHEWPRYNLQILLTTDEEVGGYSGLCYFADVGLIKGDKMLCMDGFSDDVVVGSNGIITWEATVQGRAAHSGSSFLGVNAIEKAIPIMDALMKHKKDVESRRSTLAASSALREMGITRMRPVLNINMIKGGIKENIVPEICVMRGDRRVIPEETMEGAAEELEKLIAGQEATLSIWPGYPPMRVNPDHPWVHEVMDAVEQITGSRPQIAGSHGSLDQAYAFDVTRIPAAVYGVGRQLESNAHGADENVRLSDLVNYSKFIAALIV